jgi:hypothetical protein
MRGIRVAVLSFSLLLTSTLLLPDGALAQRGIGGRMGMPGRVGGQIGIHGRGFAGPRAFHHPGFHDRRGFHGPIFRRRFDPRHRLDFFGIPGPGHHFGFPRHRLDIFGIPGPGHHFGFPRRRFFFGFPHRRFGFFGPGWFPVGIAVGGPLVFDRTPGDTVRSFGGPYLGAPLTGPAGDTLPAGEFKQGVDPRVAVAGAGGAGDSLVVERVSVVGKVTRTGVRLTWKDAGQPAGEVTLFLADATRNPLAVQAVRAPSYSALFEPPPGTAFAGMTVVWPDGSASTRVVAYRPLGR